MTDYKFHVGQARLFGGPELLATFRVNPCFAWHLLEPLKIHTTPFPWVPFKGNPGLDSV